MKLKTKLLYWMPFIMTCIIVMGGLFISRYLLTNRSMIFCFGFILGNFTPLVQKCLFNKARESLIKEEEESKTN